MAKSTRSIRASDLPTKRVTAPDGSIVQLKVVNADSPTLGQDLLAAFRSNVRRVRDQRRDRQHVDPDAAKA